MELIFRQKKISKYSEYYANERSLLEREKLNRRRRLVMPLGVRMQAILKRIIREGHPEKMTLK